MIADALDSNLNANRKSSNRLSSSVSITNERNGLLVGINLDYTAVIGYNGNMPEDLAKKRARMKEWRARNADSIAQYGREWRAKNADRLAQYDKEYRANSEAYQSWKRQYDKKYYEEVVKSDPDQMAKRAETRAVHDRANPEKHKARCDRYKQSHREILAAKARERYTSLTPEERRARSMARADYHRQWRAEHKEDLSNYGQQYYEVNKADIAVKAREYYEQNKIAFIQRANKRRVLLVGDYTDKDIASLYDTQRGICNGCRKAFNGKYEIDHVMPLSLDPSGDRLDNLQLLCRSCNRKKHASHPDAWAVRLGKLFV